MRCIAAVSVALVLQCAYAAIAAAPRVERDVAYAGTDNARQTLDLYAPAEGKGHPIVFWIHGGGWQHGDKAEVDAKPQACVDRGYVFVSVNYRLVPDVTIDVMAGDVAKAFRWVHDNAAKFGGNPNAIIVTGHSAGAQLAALVSIDERYLKAEGLSLANIKGCVPVDGDTYDVPMQIATVEQRRADIYRRKFGDEESQKNLSPVTHVARGKHIPPVLILHVADHPETKAQSERLVEALKTAGVPAKAFPCEGTEHVKLNADLGKPDDKPTKVMFEFIEEILHKGEKQ
jgi:acetyl esterase/lipase